MSSTHSGTTPKSGRHVPESVDSLLRIQWTTCSGFGGRFPPDYAVWTVAGWDVLGIAEYAFDIMRLAYLPLLTYILLTFGETMLIMQASLREVKKSEYIKTARAKGLPDSLVRDRHAVRNAILPVLSRLVISLPYLLTGVVIIESSLDWPGVGTNMWNSLYWQNMPVVMNTLLLVGILSLAARLILDLLGAYLDPRIRHRESTINTG